MGTATWRFPPSFSRAADAARRIDGGSEIGQSVDVLLRTKPGERFLVPEYGFDWSELIFDSLGGGAVSLFNPAYLKARLSDVLAVFEPRVELSEVLVRAEPFEGKATLELVLRVKSTGKLLRLERAVNA